MFKNIIYISVMLFMSVSLAKNIEISQDNNRFVGTWYYGNKAIPPEIFTHDMKHIVEFSKTNTKYHLEDTVEIYEIKDGFAVIEEFRNGFACIKDDELYLYKAATTEEKNKDVFEMALKEGCGSDRVQLEHPYDLAILKKLP